MKFNFFKTEKLPDMQVNKVESKIAEDPSTVPLEMYTVSGHGEINPDKYFRDKKQQDEIIKKEVARFSIIRKISNIFTDNSSFSEYSNNKNPNIDAIPGLIKEAFRSNDIEVIREAVQSISLSHKKNIPELIKIASTINDSDVRKWAEIMINRAPEKEQPALRSLFPEKIEKIPIKNDTPLVAEEGKNILEVQNENKKTKQELIKEAITQEDFYELNYLLQGYYHSNMTKEEEEAVSLLSNKIKEVFKTKSTYNIIRALPLIVNLPKNEQEEFVIEGLSSDDTRLQLEATKMLPYIESSDEKLYESSRVRSVLIQKVKEVFEKNGTEIPDKTVKMIRYLPEKLRPEFTVKAFEKGLGEKVIENPLYDKHYMNNETFKRQNFHKDGSNTILVGGPLKDKIIIRQIEPEAFVAWQRAYENYDLWRKNGFDYVPIEPIQSFSYNKDKKIVDVYTAVLDLNFGEWEIISGGMFNDELNKQFEKIGQVINKMRIRHRHMKRENCCLCFFRDEKGNPDITKIPRLYYIDFDMATYYEE